jgi:DNA-binding NarL/FixJ family response regulator
MTDREPADPTSVLCRQLLEREARLERLLVQLLEHDRPRARSARRAYTVLTTRLGEQIRLTERQVQILRLLATGRTSRQIAAQLQVRPATIQNHLTQIYRKLGAATRAQAAVRAVGLGLGSTGQA